MTAEDAGLKALALLSKRNAAVALVQRRGLFAPTKF
jgi:hypothetical protein